MKIATSHFPIADSIRQAKARATPAASPAPLATVFVLLKPSSLKSRAFSRSNIFRPWHTCRRRAFPKNEPPIFWGTEESHMKFFLSTCLLLSLGTVVHASEVWETDLLKSPYVKTLSRSVNVYT